MVLPWTLVVRARWRAWRESFHISKSIRFATAWALPAFVAFCFVSGKQPHYLLPLLGALAIYLATVLGREGSRVDGIVFGVVLALAGLLHGRMVCSHEAHARILSIDGSAARAIPGVHAVLVWADLPIKGGAGRAAEPLARDEVVFAGQPVGSDIWVRSFLPSSRARTVPQRSPQPQRPLAPEERDVS